jgi:hypothetical protein
VPPPGEAPAAPARRRKGIPSPSLLLAPDEVRHLRAGIRNLARERYGTVAALARALGVDPNVLTRRRRPSPALAVAVWRLTGVPVEVLLRPTLAAVPAPSDDGSPGAA